MAKHQPFVIPAGVNLDLSDRGVSIEHAGDVILHSSLGDTMNQVVSTEGSVTLRGKLSLDRISAPQGTVRIEGNVQANNVQGDVVEIVAHKFQAKAVQANKQIVLGATRISADVLVAPRIDIDAKASGRVPVIECHNEPGPNAVKGGFTAAEYDELLGNVESYLAERGVEPLEPGSGEEEEEEDEEEPSDVIIEAHEADEAELEALDDDSEPPSEDLEPIEDPDTYTEADPSGLRVGVATAAPAEAVVVDQPAELGDQALTPIATEDLQLPPGARGGQPQQQPVEVQVEPVASAISQVDETFEDLGDDGEANSSHAQLLEILAELRGCYDDGSEPPVISELGALVESHDYDEIVSRLPQIWNDLVKYHRERGLRIRRQVTTTFNNIMTIVKNAPSVTLGHQ